MTTVKVGDTIRTAEALFYGETFRQYLWAEIATPEAAECATKLVVAGKWIVLSTDNTERKDEQ